MNHYIGLAVPQKMYDALLARQRNGLAEKRKTGEGDVTVAAIVRQILGEALEIDGTMKIGRPKNGKRKKKFFVRVGRVVT